VAVTLATLPGVDLAWACVGPTSPPRLQHTCTNTHCPRRDPHVHVPSSGEGPRFGRSVRHAGAWWLPPGARPELPSREELCSMVRTADWRPNGGVERPPGMLVLESANFDRTETHDT
jgi:hypothetical protein